IPQVPGRAGEGLQVLEYDLDSTPEDLDRYCREADFVFNLAGVNRPENPEDFKKGNFGFASILLDTLKKHGNRCPIMLSSSIQASLIGRYAGHPYGESKKAGEELFFKYADETGARVLVYRFPNLFGKWCRPNYNSVVATFCHNIAHDLPIQVNDPTAELELLYIDDLVREMILALQGKEHHCTYDGLTPSPCGEGRGEARTYCYVPTTFKVTLGEIVDLLHQFSEMPKTLMIPEIPADSFAKRLFSTYLSYMPKEKAMFDLKMNKDDRGSFTELVHTLKCGQVSINISKPGITKGQHWHNTKWEQFIVVKGHGLIQMRSLSQPSPQERANDSRRDLANPDTYVLLKEHAKEMRKNPTQAESAMWEMLKGEGVGFKFRRQHIVGDYILDTLSRLTVAYQHPAGLGYSGSKIILSGTGDIGNSPCVARVALEMSDLDT
ncbi:MAG: NAD-dependent epimerase/dehydratase family protein, partial [Muribaculaceae bacterium]|nr:NAD-dependent epimerase/dehydratase family protein [Muribaculaceae bacterium]